MMTGDDVETNAMEAAVLNTNHSYSNNKASGPPPQRGVVARRSIRPGDSFYNNNTNNPSTFYTNTTPTGTNNTTTGSTATATTTGAANITTVLSNTSLNTTTGIAAASPAGRMVRISSRAAKRGTPLLPGTKRHLRKSSSVYYYRFLRTAMVLLGVCVLIVVSVAFLWSNSSSGSSNNNKSTTSKQSIFTTTTTTGNTTSKIGPDGQILRVKQHQPQQQKERRHKKKRRPYYGNSDKRQHHQMEQHRKQPPPADDQQEGDDKSGDQEEEEQTSNSAPDNNTEQGDDNDGDGNRSYSSTDILPAHAVLSLGLPYLIYGTAWKKDDTARLVQMAITAGFRFIDTACQPKHYHEGGVGDGWTRAADELSLDRRDLFLQTKFTSVSGQDPNNIPYDPTASLSEQVAESIQVSLRNLRTNYLDSLVLHGLETTMEDTMRIYRAMELAVDQGKVVRLGISNCYDYNTFRYIYDHARIKPEILQNRFYQSSHWDVELRQFCQTHDIWYQSFWTLTANDQALKSRAVQELAAHKNLSPQTLLYAYLMNLGYGTPLDGTRNIIHMQQDISVMQRMQKEFQDPDVEHKVFANEQEMRNFERLLGF